MSVTYTDFWIKKKSTKTCCRTFGAKKQIRNSGAASGPIMVVEAHQETDFRLVAKGSGFDAYVTKPIDFDWLGELLTGLLVLGKS